MTFSFRWSGRLARPLPKGCRSLLLCAATLCIAACSRPVDSSRTVTIEHEFSPEPPRIGPVVVTLRLADSAAKAITGAHITVEADMSHAGMSPAFGEAREIEPGRYQANLTFEMAGDWVILLQVVLPGGEKLERQIDVKGVRPN
jgi:YtkA-like